MLLGHVAPFAGRQTDLLCLLRVWRPRSCVLCVWQAVSPCTSVPPLSFAVLLSGDSSPLGFRKHAEALMNNVVGPLSPDMYAVTDAASATVESLQNSTLAWQLPSILGASLKTLGLLKGATSELLAELRVAHPLTVFSAITPPNASLHGVRQPTHGQGIFQWFRLRECWRLLEDGERQLRGSRPYDIVIRLRIDWTPLSPWWPCSPDIVSAAAMPFALHTAADMAFWGPRDAMAVAAGTWDAFLTHFLPSAGACANPMRRPLHVGAMLDSLRGLPVPGTKKGSWFFYAKLMTLPWLTIGNRSSSASARATPEQPSRDDEHDWDHQWGGPNTTLSRSHFGQATRVIESLRAVQRAGYDYIGTETPDGLMRHRGPLALHTDYSHGKFLSEIAWPTWMIANNISLCDLGAGTTRVLWKGASKGRMSVSCPKPSPRPTTRPGISGGSALACRPNS